jgi:membrane protease subunit HflK
VDTERTKPMLSPEGALSAGMPSPDPSDPESMMDPANKALADALQILLRILQLGLFVIFVLYLLSGLQSVKQGQTGIRLLFGAIQSEGLEPGFHFSLPYPVGGLERVDQGTVIERLDAQFWQHLPTDEERAKPTEQIATAFTLHPERDGAVVTGDGNVAHTRWQVTYVRGDATAWARNVLPEAERPLVLGAVQRGVVQAIAEVSIDDLLRQGGRDTEQIAARAAEIAQAALDRMGTGIRIQRLDLTERIPPTFLRDRFAQVQTAEQNAGKARSEALAERNRLLSEVAGGAAEPLLTLIDAYESALDKGDEDAARGLLARINGVLDGEPIELFPDGPEVEIGGEAARMVADARQYVAQTVSRRRSQLALFRAKLAQFRSNPQLLVFNEWASAYKQFTGHEYVQVLINPPGATGVEIVLNQDPQIIKDIQRKIAEREGEEGRRRRLELQRQEQFRTQRGSNLAG